MKQLLCFILPVFMMNACNSHDSQESIHVIGQAKMKVVPDMVELSLKSYNVKPAMKDAVAETQLAIQEILAVCKKYVKDPSDIKVSSISTNKAYDYRNNRDQFIGYDATQVLEVSLKDISRIEKFTEELLATKISRIENIRYNHTGADSIMRELSLLALEDARQTAQKMCGKMNVTLGKVTYLSNFEPATPVSQSSDMGNADYDMNLFNKSFGGRGFKMTAEILQFEDQAYAAFDLK